MLGSQRPLGVWEFMRVELWAEEPDGRIHLALELLQEAATLLDETTPEEVVEAIERQYGAERARSVSDDPREDIRVTLVTIYRTAKLLKEELNGTWFDRERHTRPRRGRKPPLASRYRVEGYEEPQDGSDVDEPPSFDQKLWDLLFGFE